MKICDFEQLISLLGREVSSRDSVRKRYDWCLQAREKQRLPPGDWRIWLILAGRAFGKTRTGAETIRLWVTQKLCRRICLLGKTFDDVRKTMIEGESGLLSVFPPEEIPEYRPSLRQLVWPNGAIATGYSADVPNQLRGPQFDGAWIDELCKFSYPEDVWDQLMFCLRLGMKIPRIIITTTPRPIDLLDRIMKRDDVVVTHGTSFENAAHLAPKFLEELRTRYAGTRMGLQEIEGKILKQIEGALWKEEWLLRVDPVEVPELQRIVVAIDPAVTSHDKSDETGIVVAGIDKNGRAYVLQDLSGTFSSTAWIHCAVRAFEMHGADRVVAEVNNGGELVEQLLHTLYPEIPYKPVRATRGKLLRAEPVAALYEQGRVFHAASMPKLESQMLGYTAYSLSSPDRLDALVWALSELLLDSFGRTKIWGVSASF